MKKDKWYVDDWQYSGIYFVNVMYVMVHTGPFEEFMSDFTMQTYGECMDL